MLKRSHNEVINIFMNKINHTLALQSSTSESQMGGQTLACTHELCGASWAHCKHEALRDFRIVGGVKSVTDV